MAAGDNVSNFIFNKLEIGLAATPGTAPTTYTDLYMVDEGVATIEQKSAAIKIGGGNKLQKSFENSVSVTSVEVMNADTIDSTYKGKNIWLRLSPKGTVSATNKALLVKDFLANIEVKMEMKQGGARTVTISGENFTATLAEFVAWASSVS